jgi:hypothetical protein
MPVPVHDRVSTIFAARYREKYQDHSLADPEFRYQELLDHSTFDRGRINLIQSSIDTISRIDPLTQPSSDLNQENEDIDDFLMINRSKDEVERAENELQQKYQ